VALSVSDLQRHLSSSAIEQQAFSASDGLQTAWWLAVVGRWAIVCRRSSASTSFMLAALRVLHVDTSSAPGTGSLDRAMAIHALSVATVVIWRVRLHLGTLNTLP
jgi:hypothetical protein